MSEYLLYLNADNYIAIYRQWQIPTQALCAEISKCDFLRRANTLYGASHLQKRLQAAQADSEIETIKYSNVSIAADSWTPEIQNIRNRLHQEFGLYFDSCIMNLYLNGQDYIPKHGDTINQGPGAAVATYSLGASRRFLLYSVPNKTWNAHGQLYTKSEKLAETWLHSGDLVIMYGLRTQVEYHHTVPIDSKITDPRWSLTYRLLYPKPLQSREVQLQLDA